MSAHPLLEAEDFDDLLSRAVKAANGPNNRVAVPLPTDDVGRKAILDALEADCELWQSLLFETLRAMSLEKQAINSFVFLRFIPPEPVKFEALQKIRLAPYIRFFDANESRLIVNAIDRTWTAYKESRDLDAGWDAGWKRLEAFLLDAKNFEKADKKEKKAASDIQAIPEEHRARMFRLTKYYFRRVGGFVELEKMLSILRDLFKATDSLRFRMAEPAASPSATPQAPFTDSQLTETIERARITEEALTILRQTGIDPGVSDRLSDADLKYLVWAKWRATLEPAKIRDKWNSEFPSFAIQGDKKAGSNHVRNGIKRAGFLLQRLKSK